MILVSETTFLISVTLIQVLGLVSLTTIRLSSRWHQCQLCQLVFFFFLALVGGATMLCLHARVGAWIFCSITLCIMVVGAVFDSRGGPVAYGVTGASRAIR